MWYYLIENVFNKKFFYWLWSNNYGVCKLIIFILFYIFVLNCREIRNNNNIEVNFGYEVIKYGICN